MAEASALDGRGPNDGARLIFLVLADMGLRRSSCQSAASRSPTQHPFPTSRSFQTGRGLEDVRPAPRNFLLSGPRLPRLCRRVLIQERLELGIVQRRACLKAPTKLPRLLADRRGNFRFNLRLVLEDRVDQSLRRRLGSLHQRRFVSARRGSEDSLDHGRRDHIWKGPRHPRPVHSISRLARGRLVAAPRRIWWWPRDS